MNSRYIRLDENRLDGTRPLFGHPLYKCRTCGAAVSSTVLHDDWHLQLMSEQVAQRVLDRVRRGGSM